jgi:GNAT superfamily N-acetyltransferase
MITINHAVDASRAGLAAGDLVMVRCEAPHEIDERNALLARAMAPDCAPRLQRSCGTAACRPPISHSWPAIAPVTSSARCGSGTSRPVSDREGRAIDALLLGPLAVDPAAKGAGIGTALMLRAIEKARRYGARRGSARRRRALLRALRLFDRKNRHAHDAGTVRTRPPPRARTEGWLARRRRRLHRGRRPSCLNQLGGALVKGHPGRHLAVRVKAPAARGQICSW